jgi:glycosyltransferase involved in cell wall biosynthesis
MHLKENCSENKKQILRMAILGVYIMNIVMVIPVLSTGGAERVVSNLSLNLPDEITRYIVLYDASKISYPYKGTIINLNLPGSRNPLKKIYEFILRVKKLRRLKKDYKITASVSFTENPNLINILARNKDKVIVSVRNYRSKEIKNEGTLGVCYKLLLKLLYNKADLVIAVSQGIKQDLITNFNIKSDKIKVIYNAYDIPKIQNMAEEELEEEDKLIYRNPVVITVGRLSKQKDSGI